MELDRLRPRTLIMLALLGGLAFQLLLGTSYVAAFLDPLDDSSDLPVAVVNLDEGAHGDELFRRLASRAGPVEWIAVASRAEALDGLEEKRYHGALVLPGNFSEALESFATRTPHAAVVEVLSNPGGSTSGSLVAGRAIESALDAVNATVRQAALDGAAAQTPLPGGAGVVSLDQARFLAEPIRVQHLVVNPVPAGAANGLAPTYLAMAAWIGGYFGSVALERFRAKTRLDGHRRALVVAGAAVAQAALATAVLLALGLRVPDPVALLVVVAMGTWMAYTLVSFLLDLFGLPGVVPAFALMCLGIPASGAIYPREMLPPFYQALHALNPFTWLVEALRSALHTTRAADLPDHLTSMLLLTLFVTGLSVVAALWRARRAPAATDADEPIAAQR